MENEKLENDIYSYAVTVREVENMTGINFFFRLDDETESKVELSFDKKEWEIE